VADTARAQKIADRIKTLTAANLEPIVKDPDLGFVTITDVRVTGDLQHASLFNTGFGEAGQPPGRNPRGPINPTPGAVSRITGPAMKCSTSGTIASSAPASAPIGVPRPRAPLGPARAPTTKAPQCSGRIARSVVQPQLAGT